MTLKKVIIIARHGPRTPILLLPKLSPELRSEESFSTRVCNAKLTDRGKDMCTDFGKRLGEYYKEKIKLDIKDIFVISSNVERTIESAKLAMEGFLSIVNKHDFYFNKSNITVHTDDSLAGDIRFQGEKRKYFLNCIKNAKVDYDTTNLNKQIEKFIGIDVKNHSHEYFDISSTLKCYEYDQLDMSHIPKIFFEEIYNCSHLYYQKLYSDSELVKMFIDPMLETINKIANDKNIKFAYLSTHDCTIYPLACELNDGNIVNLPEFCAHIKYEIYEDHTKIFYDDRLIKILIF
jgi:hypothetical protein